jgi:transposase-like protein
MMAYVANRMLDMEVESLTGAAHGERSASRINQRNGYRERTWETYEPGKTRQHQR